MKSKLPDIGKISPEVFEELIYPRLGRKRGSIIVPPQNGVDVGIVEIGGQAVAITTDPVFIVPEYGWERAAWFAIHILASDIVTSGLPPTYLSIDLNLPMEITEAELETMWTVMHRECEKLGMAVICGHTARYGNCHYPMVGGATVIAVGPKDAYVTPAMAKAGDHVVITKGPAIEASGIFATMFRDRIEKAIGKPFAEKSQEIFYKMSVVEDAEAAVSAGIRDNGVTAMHDATECGIWGGVYELAQAAGLGVILDKDAIVVEDGVKEICSLFGIKDPYAAISEGTLILSCRPHRSADIVRALKERGISASVAGELTPAAKGMTLVEGGAERPFAHPRVDPFWKAFFDSMGQ
ncbi:MAG: AIR synthase family protein [Candidatus Krumholzibacteria bacterium]|nr:AIR synthase family protein [Candidatus Krumholzibacteria bacterium]